MNILWFGKNKLEEKTKTYEEASQEDVTKKLLIPKKEMISSLGYSLSLIEQISLFKDLIFGDEAEEISLSRVLKLKEHLENKCLMEIVSEMKHIRSKEKSEMSQFQKEKKKFLK